MSRERLVLFDIDGTILSAGGVSGRTLAEVMHDVAGWTHEWREYDFSGRTDPQIVVEVLRRDGYEEGAVQRLLPVVLEEYERRLAAALRAEHVTLKPGVVEVVDALAGHEDVTLALLTGNLEPCARIKLGPTGLNARFPFGAYGSDDADRYCLVPIALRRARDHAGREFAGKQIVVIGDSIHDVRCGASVGVRAVAVATGKTSRAALAAESPDTLFDDLADTAAVLRAVLD